jgi:hypothetical protein
MRRQKVTLTAGLVAPMFLLPILALGLRGSSSRPRTAAGLLWWPRAPSADLNTYSYLARASSAVSDAHHPLGRAGVS